MNDLTREWLDKARADLAAARALLRQKAEPFPDQVCYLSQQSVEKHLKAVLCHNGVAFPRTHNLPQLNDLCVTIDGSFAQLATELALLDAYAVEIRYPGASATPEEAQTAAKIARAVATFVAHRLAQ